MRYFWKVIPLLVLLNITSSGQGKEPYTLALYYSAGSADMAALLEVKLSRAENVVIRDRKELEAQYFERSIFGNRAGMVISSQIDALILLERWQSRGEDAWMIRLVENPSGGLLEIRSQPWSQASPELAEALLANIEQALHRIETPKTEQRVLSILPFRVEQGQRISSHWAKRFPSMLANALTREPSLTVLERWRVGDVAWERVLAGKTPMFQANFVLHGTLRKEGADELIVTLTAEDPRAEAEVWVEEIRGTSEKPQELLDTIVEKFLSSNLIIATERHGEKAPGRESELFLREAIRAGKIRDFPRKIEAAEAAWFLRDEISPLLLFTRTKAVSIQHLGEHFASPGINHVGVMTDEDSLAMAGDFTDLAGHLSSSLSICWGQESDERLLCNIVSNSLRAMSKALIVMDAHRMQNHYQKVTSAQIQLRKTIRSLYRDLWESASASDHRAILATLGETLVRYGRHWFVESPEDFLPLMSEALLYYEDAATIFNLFSWSFFSTEKNLQGLAAPILWDENRSTPEERKQIWEHYWQTWDHEDPFIRDFFRHFSQFPVVRLTSSLDDYQEKAEALIWKYRENIYAMPDYRRFIMSAPRPFRNVSQKLKIKILEDFLNRENAWGFRNIHSLIPAVRDLPKEVVWDVLEKWEQAEIRWDYGQHLTGSDKSRFRRYGDALRIHAGNDFPFPPLVIPLWRSWSELEHLLEIQVGLALRPASPRFMQARGNQVAMLWIENQNMHQRYHWIYFDLSHERFLSGPVSPPLAKATQLEKVMENGEILVYVINEGAALVFDKRNNSWNWIEIPLKHNPRYALNGKKLLMTYSWSRPWPNRFNTNEDSAVLEIDLIHGGIVVLASTGRNPPRTLLDQKNSLARAEPFYRSNGQRGLLHNNRIYLYETDDDWHFVTQLPRKGQLAETNGQTLLITEDRGAFFWNTTIASGELPIFPDLPLQIESNGSWEFPGDPQSDEVATGHSHQYAFNNDWFIVRRAFPLGENWEWILKVYPRENDGMDPHVYRLLVEEFGQISSPGIGRWHLKALPQFQWLHLSDDHFYQSTTEGIVRLAISQLYDQGGEILNVKTP